MSVALMFVALSDASAVMVVQNDENGANDEPNQKDLTQQGSDPAGLPANLQVFWAWDDTAFSGANTGDGCALFDTDADGKVNYALCVTVEGDPAAQTDTRLYSCGDDAVDRCTSPVTEIPVFGSTCSTSITATDPFVAGDEYPDDTVADCNVVMADFAGATDAKLINTCSYPSEQPNSDPSDCVLIVRDGFLIIEKIANPDDPSATFDFNIDGDPVSAFTANGSETSGIIPVKTTSTHSIVESAPPGWVLDSASCSDNSGTLSQNTLSGVNIGEDETVTCTFTNTLPPSSLTVIKNVVNNNSGALDAADFTLSVKNGGIDVLGSPQAGSEVGTVYNLPAGSYNLSETPVAGYAGTISGDCDAAGDVTLGIGENLTCTITNDDDINPSIDVEKSVDESIIYSGDSVTYTVTAENDGDDPLINVTASDPDCSPLTYQSGDTGADAVMSPGEIWSFTCTTALTSDLVNTATVEGDDTEGNPVNDTGSATVNVIDPSISVDKSVDESVIYSGDSVTYTVTAENTGDDPLTNVVANDPDCSPLDYVSGDTGADDVMDPGETWTFTCTTSLTNDLVNTATVTGDDSLAGAVTDTGSAAVNVLSPSIDVEKTVDQSVIYSGDSVIYTVTAENDGDDPLTSVVASDPDCSPLDYVSGDTGADDVMDPGETWTFSCTTSLTSDLVNTATVEGDDSLGGLVDDSDTAAVNVINPSIAVDKSVDKPVIYSGDSVIYTVTAENTGDDPLTNVVANDPDCSPLDYVSGDTGADDVMDPGEAWTFTCTTTLTSDLVNTATVTGDDSLAGAVTDTGSATVNVIDPEITVEKSVDKPIIYSGDSVTYTVTAENTGDDPLTDITPSDPDCSPLTYVSGDTGADDVMDPGETWTFSCTTSLTSDLVNTATVEGDDSLGNPVDDTGSATVNVINPTIAVDKSVDKSVIDPGDSVTYTVTAENTGDDPLTDITPSDPDCSPLTYVSGDTGADDVMDPGEIWTFTCTTTLTSDLVNTATVEGDDSLGNPVDDTGSTTVNVINPSIAVEKSVDKPVIYSGESVTYTVTAENTGDDPLTDITPSDPDCSPLTYVSGDTGADDVMSPGETWTFTCTTSLTNDLVNTATVSGDDSLAGAVTDTGSATVNVINPSIDVDKSVDKPIIYSGDSVIYTVTAENDGDDPLTNVVASDPDCSPLDYVSGDTGADDVMDPGETWTFSCTTSLTSDLVNTATVEGDDSLGNPVDDTGSATVNVINPTIAVDKSVDKSVIDPGDSVTYTVTAENTGDDPLTDITPSDPDCSPLTYVSGDTGADDVMDPGEIWTFTCTTTLTSDLVNTATVSGEDSLSGAVTDTGSATVNVINPEIAVEKSVDKPIIYSGDSVIYTVTAENTGDDPLTNVVANDPDCSPLDYVSGDTGADDVMDPGETWTFTCTTSLTSDLVNTATVAGDDSLGNPVSDTGSATVNVINPSIDVQKTVDETVIYSGDSVTYTVTAENDGDDPLTNVAANDPDCSPLDYVSGDTGADDVMDPGETWTFSCTTALTADLVNTASVAGDDSLGAEVKDSDTATVNVINPAIAVEKSVDKPVIYSGETVIYTVTAENTGDDPLTDITPSDPDCSPLTYVSGDTGADDVMSPGETWTFTCTTSLTNDLVNTATVAGDDTLGGAVTDTGSATVNVLKPAIKVEKTVDKPVIYSGDTVVYTVTAENTGDDPLTDITPSDPDCSPLTYVSGDTGADDVMSPGELWTFTCTTSLVNDLVNTATVASEDTLGNPVSDTGSATVNVINPSIAVDKSVDKPVVYSGDSVIYTVVATNTGDDPLTNVSASDPDCSPLTYVSGDTGADTIMDPTEAWTFTCTTALTSDLVNTATVEGDDSAGNPVSDTGSATVNVINPAITVNKSVDDTLGLSGQVFNYTVTVSNTGDDPVTSLDVADPNCAPLVYLSGDTGNDDILGVGETWTYTCSTALSQTTLNTATATGKDTLGGDVTDDANANVQIINPSIKLTKTVDQTLVLSGTTVTYTVEVNNDGDSPLSSVDVDDPTCSPLTYQSGDVGSDDILGVGETWIYTCSKVITQTTVNVATVTATTLDQGTVTASGSATVNLNVPVNQQVTTPAVVLNAGTECKSQRFRIRPTITGGTAVSSVLRIDGRRRASSKSSNPSFVIDSRKYKVGRHRIQIDVTLSNGQKLTTRGSFSRCKVKTTKTKIKPKFTG